MKPENIPAKLWALIRKQVEKQLCVVDNLVRLGRNNLDSEPSFDARHDATGMASKKYINKLRWDNKARLGSFIDIPDQLFKK